MTSRARRLVLATAAASVAAVCQTAPVSWHPMVDSGPSVVAAPACIARVTSQGDEPICVGTSNGQPINVGTPGGVYGPNGTNGGITSGPLLPGQSWNGPVH